MPTCPGCEQSIPHRRLRLHERYCQDIWGGDTPDAMSLEQLDRRLAALERRLDRRVRALEADLERELRDPESARSRGESARH